MKIPSTFIEELKNRLNITAVAREYMNLVKRGKNYFALCPFHQEKTPSFSINEQLQFYHCFGCGKSGDVITLVMEMEKVPYFEAIKMLAEKVHLTIPMENAKEEEDYKKKKFLYKVMEEAEKFFHHQLMARKNGTAFRYLNDRGIGLDTIKKFQIGYAPETGYDLMSYLNKIGIGKKFILASGLGKYTKDGSRLYDYFRNRLMIPIKDYHGRTIAFGGRILSEGEPKYLNSPETPIYKKRYHLFGMNLSLESIRSRDRAILVEGYFDMIVPFQAGIENIVASLGTSLTPSQVKLLGRFTRNVVISYDPDAAGSRAALRSVELFLEHDFDCFVAILPEGKDPDLFIREKGLKHYNELISKAVPFLDFIWMKSLTRNVETLSIKERIQIIEKLFPFIIKIPSEAERLKNVSHYAQELKLDENAVFHQLKKFYYKGKIEKSAIQFTATSTVTESERLILNFLFKFPEEATKLFSEKDVTFEGSATSKILTCVRDQVCQEGRLDIKKLESFLSQDDIVFLHRILSQDTGNISFKDAQNCLNTIKIKSLMLKKEELRKQLHDFEENGNMKSCIEIVNQIKNIDKEIKQLKI